MDIEKSLNLKLSFRNSAFESSKMALIVASMSVLVSFYLIHAIVNIYFDYDEYNTIQNHLQVMQQETQATKQSFKALVKNNADYFLDLKTSPRSRSELATTLTKLVTDNNLKLIRLNSNENIQAKKDALIELEASGTYANIDRFSRILHKTIGASEVQSFKLSKQKEDGYLHITLNLKFAAPPNLTIPELAPNNPKFGYFEPNYFSDWKLINAAFVPADDKNNASSEVALPAGVNKDPFQSTIVNDVKRDAQTDTKTIDRRISGYFLSGIFYSKHHRYCVIALPSGESKVFSEGERISPKLVVEKISRGHVVTNNKKSLPTQVGEELLP